MQYVSSADNLTFRGAAAIICVTCLFYSTMMRKRSRIRNRLFTMLVSFTLIGSLTSIIEYFIVHSGLSHNVKMLLYYLMEMLYFFVHFGVIPVFVFYIVMICGIKYKLTRLQRELVKVPFYILELMVLSNPLTDIVFAVDEDFTFHRGAGIYLAYALSGFYLFLSLWLMFRYWYIINNMKKVAMAYFMILIVAGTAIQMLYPFIVCELLCESIGLMGIMVMIEKDDDRTDSVTNVYNRNAFVQDVRNFFLLERGFTTVCLRIENLDILRKLYDHNKIDKLLKDIADFLIRPGEDLDVYHINIHSFFILYTGGNTKAIEKKLKSLVERFDKTWQVGNESVKLEIKVLCAESPNPFDKIDDLFLLSTTKLDETEKTILKGDDLGFLIRRLDVEKAIGRGISEKNFKVTYRPLYSAQTLRIKAAEVVLKLKDSELGEIYSEEFMNIADDSGFIEELQFRTIEAVCRFLGSGADTSDMQLDFIIIPVMSIKMANRNLVQKVKEYLEHYNLDPSLFAFSISENHDFYGHLNAEEMIDGFDELGIKMFISNYESAFLGLNTNASYRFGGAIIDVKDTFEVGDADSGNIVLANRTNMIRQLGKIIVLGGVSNYDYFSSCEGVSVDYIAGSLLSDAVSKNELQNKFWHGEQLIVTKDKVERIEEDGKL